MTFLQAAIIISFVASAQKKVPELWGHRIHDETQVLSTSTIHSLEKRLQLYEDSTSNQIAVLITSSLEGDILEQYTIRVADEWKLGERTNDNGVLLFLAIEDHAIRIEVGDGLEGVLTDALASRIIRNEIAPRLRKDDFDGAITAGIDAIIRAIGNEYQASEEDNSTSSTIVENIIYGVFLLLMVVFTVVGVFAEGCFGWGLYAILIPCYFTLPWSLIGKNATLALLCVFIVGFPIARVIVARNPKLKRKLKGSKFTGVTRPVARDKKTKTKQKGSSFPARAIGGVAAANASFNYNDTSSSHGDGSGNDNDSSSSWSDNDNFSGGGGSFSGGGSSGTW